MIGTGKGLYVFYTDTYNNLHDVIKMRFTWKHKPLNLQKNLYHVR